MIPLAAGLTPRSIGLALAVLSVAAPALPLGPLAGSPPIPLAAMWLAYGWAADGEVSWTRPLILFALGLAHDQISGGPLGLMAVAYLAAFVFGGMAVQVTRSYSLITEWGGFAATALAAGVVAAMVAALALDTVGLRPFVLAAGLTVLAFPLVRPIYLVAGAKRGGAA